MLRRTFLFWSNRYNLCIDKRIGKCYVFSAYLLADGKARGEIMTHQINWLEVFNSATTFAILTAIAVGIWMLVLKKDFKKESRPRSKSSKR